jgi:hypothetical protein
MVLSELSLGGTHALMQMGIYRSIHLLHARLAQLVSLAAQHVPSPASKIVEKVQDGTQPFVVSVRLNAWRSAYLTLINPGFKTLYRSAMVAKDVCASA